MQMFKTTQQVRGEFDVDVQTLDESGSVVESRRIVSGCPNLITNKGMDDFGNSTVGAIVNAEFNNAWMGYCQVGGSSTPPANTDTSLGAYVAGRVQDQAGSAVWSAQTAVYTTVFTFPAGTATGNISELGLSSSTASGNLRTHALVKDAEGNPITITVLSTEQLVITYRLLISFAADSVYVTTTSPTPTEYTITTRPANLGAGSPGTTLPLGGIIGVAEYEGYRGASSGIGPRTGTPNGTVMALSTGTTPAPSYTSGSYVRNYLVTVPSDQWNFADIGAVQVYTSPFRVQMGISPRLTKASGTFLRFNIAVSWARA